MNALLLTMMTTSAIGAAVNPFLCSIEGDGADAAAGAGGSADAGAAATALAEAAGGGDDSAKAAAGSDTQAGGAAEDTANGAAGGDEMHGAPEGDYELKLPEGMELDKDAMAIMAPVFKELNLSNAGAQKAIGTYAEKIIPMLEKRAGEQLSAAYERRDAETRKAWLDAAKADPEHGGDKWDETMRLSALALDKFGAPKGSEFRTWLNETGFGNHPVFIGMFSKIGKALADDGDFVRTNAGGPVEQNIARVLYPNEKPKEA